MSLLGRLARALTRVIPIDHEQFAEQSAVHRSTRRLAESQLSDEEAKRELQTEIAAHPAGVEPTLQLMSRGRDDYVGDRSYRLLRAAVDDNPVEPIAADAAELFRREEELGQMSIKDAFALLADLEPALHDVEGDVRAGRLTAQTKHRPIGSAEVPLGPAWKHADPLLRSNLALSIARHYLDVLGGSDQLSDINQPYSAAARKRAMWSGTLFGSPQDPPARRN